MAHAKAPQTAGLTGAHWAAPTAPVTVATTAHPSVRHLAPRTAVHWAAPTVPATGSLTAGH
eukprot:scaffold262_cov230-Pinguiococcus_pyrenoidosus.AAC.18